MSNLRLIAENFSDNSILIADPVMPAATPVGNLQSISRSKIIRTNAYGEPDSTQDILGNLLPAKDVSAVVLGRHNFPIGTDITIILYTGLDQTGTPTSSGILTVTADEAGSDVIAWGSFVLGGILSWGQETIDKEFETKANYVYWLTTPVADVQSFKISIVVQQQEVEVGRLIIGEYIEPTYNLSKGHKLTWAEDTKQYRTDGGTLRSDISIPYRRMEFDISAMTEVGRSTLQSAIRNGGLRRDMYISLFPEDPAITKKKDYSGIVKCTKVPSVQELGLPNYYKSKFVMEEV